MATRAENKILAYIAKNGSITRFEIELPEVEVDIYTFLDCMAALKFKGWVQTRQEERKSAGGRDMLINVYSFTKHVESQFKRHYQKLTIQKQAL
ncbi:hypothetical protein [Gracilimonas tropica]|uniref:hypothetical protein n=1 Tax=Gracilimonas tropica TaxID=454600 RepID=UPI0003794028|nr:hypothetical protein [Gracilimonas tropica]